VESLKPTDEYPWQGRNSFNSGIFVILKKLWSLNWPLLSSQIFPALKWLFKSRLTVQWNLSNPNHLLTHFRVQNRQIFG
jgi:hypothetical protein